MREPMMESSWACCAPPVLGGTSIPLLPIPTPALSFSSVWFFLALSSRMHPCAGCPHGLPPYIRLLTFEFYIIKLFSNIRNYIWNSQDTHDTKGDRYAPHPRTVCYSVSPDSQGRSWSCWPGAGVYPAARGAARRAVRRAASW